MNDQTQERMRRLFPGSKARMHRLVELKAPDVIIANEALILLRTYHGGCWRGIWYWTWKEIRREASDVVLAFEMAAYATWFFLWHGLPRGEAMRRAENVIIDRIEKGGKA
jgi:hypothetical protein